MLGLFLIYFIGKSYYHLAHDYDKSRWGYAILGIAVYYAGTFMGGFILGIIGVLSGSMFHETLPNFVLGLLCLPFGLLLCWGIYKMLETIWEKKTIVASDNSLDGNLIDKY